ncbi:hypothetical protein PTKIN_Ptkin19aG0115400 [Pterospermum kingtungense]
MALFRKLFYRKPPEGLVEICERVYVFDCCFTTDVWEEEDYKIYIKGIVNRLQDHFPDASFLVFNFREDDTRSQMAEFLSDYDMTILDYPSQYKGCPLMAMEVLHHFLGSCANWLSLDQHNLLLMHSERGGWPVLAFVLAALLIYRKQYSGEYKTLDMIYKQAPRELLQLLSPMNPVPSQLRYLQYVSRRNVPSEWPPSDRALTLDCVILRYIPNIDGNGGCCPIFRIYGQDPLHVADRTPKVLYSTPKRSKSIRYYKQIECVLVKIDINCHVQGDVVVECMNLNDDMEREGMIFRVVFNTAFIRSNILMLNRDEIDTLWDAKELFPKEFRAEILFSEMDAASASSIVSPDFCCFEDKEGLPMETFAKVQEIFSNVDWFDLRADIVAFNILQHIGASNIAQEKFDSNTNSNQEETKLKALASSPRSPTYMAMKIRCVLSQKPSVDSDASKEAKSQDSNIEPFGTQSDVKHQENNQSTANLHDSVPSGDQTSHLTAANDARAISDRRKVAKTKSILLSLSLSPQSPLSSALEPAVSSPARETGTYLQNKGVSPLLTPPCQEDSAVRVTPLAAPPPPPASPMPPPTSPLNKIEAVTDEPLSIPPPPPPPPQASVRAQSPVAPPPPPPPPVPPLKENSASRSAPPPSPLPPVSSRWEKSATASSSALQPPPLPTSTLASISSQVPAAPPPPASVGKKTNAASPEPRPPFISSTNSKNMLSHTTSSKSHHQTKKLKPLHWLKLSRAVQGSLWAEAQKLGEASKAPEIDISELENLFSAAAPNTDRSGKSSLGTARGPKSDKVQLIDLRRAYNCEIMLSKVKVPLPELMSSVLALEKSALDVDQVDNLIKFCPTKEEMELLKGYTGEKEKLGKCEQFFLELMKVPRVESKLRVFSFKIRFRSQASDLRRDLNVINTAAEEARYTFFACIIRNSVKLRRIMQTILSLGNALNQGTARGSAIGFRLDSLLKLTETRARDNKMTLMHYLCKVLADKLPDLLDFSKDISSLEPASKIQLKVLAEEMQAITKGLEKVVQELSSSENDGPVSQNFRKVL